MDCKPITPNIHGMVDYAFSAIQMGVPRALNLNQKTTNTYCALGTGFLAINALTDTQVGIRPVISFRDHQKTDAAFLAGLSLLILYKPIRKNKKSLCFHLSFLAVAVCNYCLTDYKAGREGYLKK